MARSATSNSRVGQTLTGVGAAAVVALIGALPLLLIWATENPLAGAAGWIRSLGADPAATLTALWQTMSTRDDDHLFVHVLTAVAWVAAVMAAWAWNSFLASFLAAFIEQLRAHRSGRTPRNPKGILGMRLQQRAAAALAAAIIGAVAAPTLASASVGMPTAFGQPAAAATQHTDISQPSDSSPVRQQAAPPTGYLEVQVQRGESLLDVAEQHGIAPQWLAEANYGVAQPDGRSLQPGSMRVYPGWTLHVPTTRTVAVGTTTKTAVAPMVYEVARGDRLGDIAGRFLGDEDRYPEIARDNPALEQRDARFPDHIERSWRITRPGDARDRGPREHATGAVITGGPTDRTPGAPAAEPSPAEEPGGGAAADGSTTQTPAPGAAPPSAAATATTPATRSASDPAPAPPPVSAAPSAGPSAAQSALGGTAGSDAHDQDGDSWDVEDAAVVGSLAGAGLLAALLLAAVLRRRHRQRQHRRPGRRLPHPRGGAIEKTLRVAEQPADVDRLDTALRSLTASLAHREQLLPDIAAAWIINRTVTVVLTAPCPSPPAPWIDHRGQWTLPGDAALPAIDDELAPLPTLVAVGSQPGRHLLLDLERLGSLTIGGDPDRAIALLRYLASELACNTWSDDVEVIIAGFPLDESELLVALNPDRIRAVSSINDAATRLRRRIVAVTAALHAAGSADTLAGRITDVGEAWAPQVLLVANADESDLAALSQLGQELHAAGRCAVAVASAAPVTVPGLQHTATVDEEGVLHVTLASTDKDIPFLHVDAVAAGLPVRELEPLAEIMSQARSTDTTATPPALEPEIWAQGTDAAGAVLDLITAPGAVAPDTDNWSEPSDPRPHTTADRAGVQIGPTPANAAAAVHPVALPPAKAASTVTTSPRREIAAAIRQRRRQADPRLDEDLRAWLENDQDRPRIAILGPVAVHAPGPAPDERRRFYAEIITYLAQRGERGASGDQLSEALWPHQQVKAASRRARSPAPGGGWEKRPRAPRGYPRWVPTGSTGSSPVTCSTGTCSGGCAAEGRSTAPLVSRTCVRPWNWCGAHRSTAPTARTPPVLVTPTPGYPSPISTLAMSCRP